MKKILVPVDFSEHSEYALEAAATLARRHKADIVVLHMLGLSEADLDKDHNEEFMEAQYYMKLAKKRFDLFLNQPWLNGLKIARIVQNYTIFSEINNLVKEQNIDLVVMGSHGTAGLSEIFVGSNTEKVVRTSLAPVLVIKEQISDFTLKKVVFGFDFQLENIAAYTKAMTLFNTLKSEISFVHINLPGIHFMSSTEIQEQVDTFLRAAHHGRVPIALQVHQISDYSVEKGLYNFAKKVNADFIAVATHGRSGLAHFFRGSISEDLANHSSLPVMTFRI